MHYQVGNILRKVWLSILQSYGIFKVNAIRNIRIFWDYV